MLKWFRKGSWKDYGLIFQTNKLVLVFLRMLQKMLLYKICKNFKPKNKNLKYLITDTNGKILKNSFDLNFTIKKY